MVKKKQKERGFTLIEIMVVVIIIGMLATLVGLRVFNMLEKGKRNTAVVQIKNFEAGLSAYRLDNGRYPTTEQGLEALIRAPSIEPRPKSYPQGGYLQAREIPLDPWDHPYVYYCPGLDGEEYTIISYGADGEEGGEGNNADIISGRLENEGR